MNDWSFDLLSALIGAGAMLLLVGLGYLIAQPALNALRAVSAGLGRLTGLFSAGSEGRYRSAVMRWAQQAHTMAPVGPLASLFVPPRLIPPPSAPDLEVEISLPCEPLSLDVALIGYRCLLIVGDLASGRSTLLAFLALAHALRETDAMLGFPSSRLPILVDLTRIEWTSPKQVTEDWIGLPQEAIRLVGGPAAAKKRLQQRLEAGTALVLIDGWDELEEPERRQAAAWLAYLTDAFPNNLWLVTTGPRGYAPLTEAAFAPLRLARWERQQAETLLSNFAALLPSAGQGDQKDAASDDEEQDQPLHNPASELIRDCEKGASALDLTLQAWLIARRGSAPSGRFDRFKETLQELGDLKDDKDVGLSATVCETLGILALDLLKSNGATVTRKNIEEALERALPLPEERAPRVASKAQRLLTKSGFPLVPCGADAYAFVHPLWLASMAAQKVDTLPPAALKENIDDPRWLPVMDFVAEVGEIRRVAEIWLDRPDDLWHHRLCTAARWASRAAPGAPWRNGVMTRLARAFLEPSLPMWTRRRLAEALADTGDPGVPLFLRQALQHPLEAVRAAAAYAMGRLQEQADVDALVQALGDPHTAVQAAASVALGCIGTDIALQWLGRVLEEGEETLRVETARGLARVGETGWKVLREMADGSDFLTRRAVAYGLGEVEAPWARELLEHIAEEDAEWIVRSAAAGVLADEKIEVPMTVAAPPLVSEMGWLIAWAAEQGEGVAKGVAALGPLKRALEKAQEPGVRRAAAHVLGLVGRPEHVDALRRAVGDPAPEVSHVSFWALEELACRYDLFVQ